MQTRVEDLRRILIDTMDKTATVRDLINRHGFSKQELECLAAAFPDKLETLTLEPGPKGGRPSEIVRIPNRKLEVYTNFPGNAA